MRPTVTPAWWSPPVEAWSPADLAGLQLWLKADAIVGLADGDPVTTWEDSTANNVDVTQATGAAKPTYKTAILNGLPVVRFDGTDDVLRAASAITPRHVFVVAKYAAASFISNSGYSGLISGEGAAAAHLILTGEATGGTSTKFYNETITTAYHKNGTSFAETDMQAPMNTFGVLSISSTAFTSMNPQLGQDRNNGQAGRFWNGDVAEALMYDSVLSTDDRRLVEAYLGDKYAITVV
jgi:hypothetical protein